MIAPTVWREPADETVDYPNLVVHDGRQTGSITAGHTRLPLWAFVPGLVRAGWGDGEVVHDYPSADEVGCDGLVDFVYYLLETRGEFGRLICTIADVERQDRERDQHAYDTHWAAAHGPADKICECMPPSPGPWWLQDDLRARMVAQLRACLQLLEVDL